MSSPMAGELLATQPHFACQDVACGRPRHIVEHQASTRRHYDCCPWTLVVNEQKPNYTLWKWKEASVKVNVSMQTSQMWQGAGRLQPPTSTVDSTVPGSRNGAVQKASMTGTLGSRWYATMR